MRYVGMVLLCGLAIGCTAQKSGIGREAMLYRTDPAKTTVAVNSPSDDFGEIMVIPIGTRVSVLGAAPDDPLIGEKRVRVSIKEGPFQGKVGFVSRDDLRPPQ